MGGPEKTEPKQSKGWKPGQSGNPQGRPKGAKNKATIAAQMLLDGEALNLTRRAVELALKGDATALRLCLERVVAPRKGRSIVLNLPKIETNGDIGAVLDAMLGAISSGNSTAEEVSAVLPIIETRMKAIELTDLAERLAHIEDMLETSR